jgi:UDP-N-acetylmuramate--alanine ligase
MTSPRGKASVGIGLAPARPARPIRPGERIHVVGAAGAGASAAALLAHAAGAEVTGCDPGGPSPYTPPILAAGIPMAWQHDPAHVAGVVLGVGGATVAWAAPERLAVTKALTAVDPDNAELMAARAAGIPIEPWQQTIADAAAQRLLAGVAGTHGKSTTSGWLVHVLVQAGLDPWAFVGALLPAGLTGGMPSTARWGTRVDAPFVVEADEYAGNFDAYRPGLAVLTSAEWDHPDVFADRAAVVDCFAEWLERAAESGRPVLVANVADSGVALVAELLRRRSWPGQILGAALVSEASAAPAGAPEGSPKLLGSVERAGPDGTQLKLEGDWLERPLSVRLRLAGRHNASNAICVAGAALGLGVKPDALAGGLESFTGVGRRLERKGEGRGVVVYDDYGHHPTAIRETLAAVRQLEPGRRIWAVYEPLTYHRTAAMLEEFAEVLSGADGVAVAEIWASRDPDTTITSAEKLAAAVARKRPEIVAEAPGSVEETAAWLATRVKPGEAVLVMGGGKSYRIAELLLEALAG